jgi:hypothetical protein
MLAALADQDHETHGANNTHHALLHVSKMMRKSQPKVVSSSTSLNWISISVFHTQSNRYDRQYEVASLSMSSAGHRHTELIEDP